MTNLTSIHGGNQTLIDNPDLCTPQTCDLSLGQVDYLPTVAGNALYAAIFGLLVICQIGFGIRYKTWGYMIALLCGLVIEIVGYIGRIMMHNNIFDNNSFIMYLVCLTIAPAFLGAGIYLCLSRIVTVYGAGLSRFKPRTYTIVFCSCDFFSLVLQAIGGGIAATANTQSAVSLESSHRYFVLLMFSDSKRYQHHDGRSLLPGLLTRPLCCRLCRICPSHTPITRKIEHGNIPSVQFEALEAVPLLPWVRHPYYLCPIRLPCCRTFRRLQRNSCQQPNHFHDLGRCYGYYCLHFSYSWTPGPCLPGSLGRHEFQHKGEEGKLCTDDGKESEWKHRGNEKPPSQSGK